MGIDNKNEDIDTSNIFDDFTDDDKLKDEIQEIVQKQQKDGLYYINKTKWLLKFLIVLLVLFIFLAYLYLTIQKSTNYSNSSLIDPICVLILWNVSNDNNYCSSIASLNEQYTNELESIKNKQNEKIDSIFTKVFKTEDFLYSKEVIFLKNKTDWKLDVINIMDDFDQIINKYEPLDKKKINCFNMEIFNTNKVNITCEVFWTKYDSFIRWFDWTTKNMVWWTSISYANSFINFIKTQQNKFLITKEQKTFNSTSFPIDNWFTEKTKFNLELQYNSDNIIF